MGGVAGRQAGGGRSTRPRGLLVNAHLGGNVMRFCLYRDGRWLSDWEGWLVCLLYWLTYHELQKDAATVHSKRVTEWKTQRERERCFCMYQNERLLALFICFACDVDLPTTSY